jgi:replicative DNA helicase
VHSERCPKHLTRATQLDQIANGLKRLAVQQGVAVAALSQVNRDAARRSERDANDLRDSGGITQAADAIFILTCQDRDGARNGRALVDYDLAVAKNRYGRKPTIRLGFNTELGIFGDAPPERARAAQQPDGYVAPWDK